MAVVTPTFSGFGPEAIQFLADLTANNERAWFQPRKAEFERLLKEPLESLIEALAGRFEARHIPLCADPARSPFRIYRDVRFSKDKSPYKTNIGASFPWAGESTGEGGGRSHAENVHSSGGYFHLSPGEIYVGGGIWHPERAWLATFRQRLVEDPRSLRKLIDGRGFRSMFGSLGGDALQRVPTGFPADHPEAELLKLKDVTFGRRLSDKDATSPTLPDLIADTFEQAMPVMRYLASVG
jgi:uncharacterized protein (TIGR02453 family)